MGENKAKLSFHNNVFAGLYRRKKDAKGDAIGIAGSIEELAKTTLTSQPISSFDWSPDKAGLFCCAALDQCVRVGFVTKVNNL